MATSKDVEKSENARLQEAILTKLAELGGLRVQDDSLIFRGSKFILPETMAGRLSDAIDFLRQWQEGQEQEYTYTREYPYRPYDGAAAFERAMKNLFGTTGVGQVTRTFYGDYPPAYHTIDVGPNETIQVPWGLVGFEPLNAVFHVGQERNPEYGIVFELTVKAPKKFQAHIDAFMQAIEVELRERSIYRGKAINAAPIPGFLDTRSVDPSRVIYTEQVVQQLEANVWSLLRYSATMRQVGLPLKRQVLLYGPYGTGKTLAGLLTAQIAEQNGWTYIQVRSGEDDLYNALKTARLYAPAVVMFEDVDQIKSDTTGEVAKLLDQLDSVSNKGTEVVAVFTTNHPERLHKGMMRPGRLDAVIELSGLDMAGIVRLVKANVPEKLLGDIDWGQVTAAFDGLLPAFAREAIDRAKRYGIARRGGVPQEITTSDLVGAADGIRAQVKMMEEAPLASDKDPLTVAFGQVLNSALTRHVVEWDGDKLPIKPAENNGR